VKVAAQRHLTIARRFNGGYRQQPESESRRDDRNGRAFSAAPPGREMIFAGQPAVETAGYCQMRLRRGELRRLGVPPAGAGQAQKKVDGNGPAQ